MHNFRSNLHHRFSHTGQSPIEFWRARYEWLSFYRSDIYLEMAGENIKKAKELEPNNEEIDTQLRDIEEILKQKKERESKTTIETTQG